MSTALTGVGGPEPCDGEAYGMRAARRASILVLPFSGAGISSARVAEFSRSMAHNITARLVRQRRLYVVASAEASQSSWALQDAQKNNRVCRADYVVSGSVLCTARRFKIDVQLIQAKTARVIWADVFRRRMHSAFHTHSRMVRRIASAIELEVQAAESNRTGNQLSLSGYRASPGKLATAIRARPGALRARRRLSPQQPGDSPSTRSLPIEDVSMRRPVRPPADSG